MLTDFDEHVHFCAQRHHLQGYRGNFVTVRLGDLIWETEAVDLLVGVSVQEQDSPTSLMKNITTSQMKPNHIFLTLRDNRVVIVLNNGGDNQLKGVILALMASTVVLKTGLLCLTLLQYLGLVGLVRLQPYFSRMLRALTSLLNDSKT